MRQPLSDCARDTRSTIAARQIIEREGGATFTNDPDDPGGPTKFGVTLNTLKEWRNDFDLTAEDVASLGFDEAEELLKQRYMVGPRIAELDRNEIFYNVADAAVLHGPGTAIRWLQKAVNATIDGVIGPETLGQANHGMLDVYRVVTRFKELRVEHILDRVANGRSHPKYLNGWVLRAVRV